jgi:hypothetical protein
MFLQPFTFKVVHMSRILSLVAATLFAMSVTTFAQQPSGTPAPANASNSEKLDKGAKTGVKKKEAREREERRAQERKERRDLRKDIHHRQRRHS